MAVINTFLQIEILFRGKKLDFFKNKKHVKKDFIFFLKCFSLPILVLERNEKSIFM
jgi:hypothetical protein